MARGAPRPRGRPRRLAIVGGSAGARGGDGRGIEFAGVAVGIAGGRGRLGSAGGQRLGRAGGGRFGSAVAVGRIPGGRLGRDLVPPPPGGRGGARGLAAGSGELERGDDGSHARDLAGNRGPGGRRRGDHFDGARECRVNGRRLGLFCRDAGVFARGHHRGRDAVGGQRAGGSPGGSWRPAGAARGGSDGAGARCGAASGGDPWRARRRDRRALLVGPEPTSLFTRMGMGASYALPIVGVALVLVGFAVREARWTLRWRRGCSRIWRPAWAGC